jgi:hypothetical protein
MSPLPSFKCGRQIFDPILPVNRIIVPDFLSGEPEAVEMMAFEADTLGKPEGLHVAALRVKDVDFKPLGTEDTDIPKLLITRLKAGLIYDKSSSSAPRLDGGFIK